MIIFIIIIHELQVYFVYYQQIESLARLIDNIYKIKILRSYETKENKNICICCLRNLRFIYTFVNKLPSKVRFRRYQIKYCQNPSIINILHTRQEHEHALTGRSSIKTIYQLSTVLITTLLLHSFIRNKIINKFFNLKLLNHINYLKIL